MGADSDTTRAADVAESEAEAAWKKSEQRFKAIFNATFQSTGLLTPEGLVIEVNDAALDSAGIARENALNIPLWETPRWRGNETRVKQLKDAIARAAKGEFVRYEVELHRAEGAAEVVDFSLKPVFDKSGKVTMLVPEGRDITERKQVEFQREKAIEELRLRESYLSAIVENQPGLLWMKDQNGCFLVVNTLFANSSGFDNPQQLVGKTDFDVWPEILAASYVTDDKMVMKSGKPYMVEEQISDKGDIRWFETFKSPILDKQGTVIGTTGYSRDITERRMAQEEHLKYEQQLQQNQRLESLGILAGGIAHDFNNLLTGIFGHLELARFASKDSRVIESLDTTIATINRARALTMQLLTFSKGGSPVQKIMPLLRFVQDTAHFALSGSNVSCEFSFAKDLWQCNVDKNQMGQVIDNILINAQQAMPKGGVVHIVAQNIVFREKEHPSLTMSDYVKLSITDGGIGIPKEIVPRIFDPFFTTKPTGHGLGLATCYSIIRRHGGWIEVESEPGNGSTFHIYLPAFRDAVVEETTAQIGHKGNGTIVVMDDEAVIRSAIKKMLETMGYTVVCANEGKAAIEFYINETKAGRPIVTMFFDHTVAGGMGGIDAVAEIRKLNRSIPVFVVSGYTVDPVMRNPAEYGFTASICKPFTMAELSTSLNKYLDRGAEPV